jgi:phosphatidylglycerophosphatase A
LVFIALFWEGARGKRWPGALFWSIILIMKKWLAELGVFWATFFYVGKSPKAPGTCGSLAALPLAWGAWTLGPVWGWAITVLVFITGTLGAAVVGGRSGNSDDQSIVIDEVVGILITTSICRFVWWQYGLAFLLFRLFDITKPWPVSVVDRKWKSALGTMIDDALAAVMATAVLWAVLWGIEYWGHA